MDQNVGRYRLLELIGKGSGGEVWRAQDPEIGRPVAVKLLRLPEAISEDETSQWEQRFLREARAAGRLSHPGIVPVFDVGKADDGRPFIVMELIEGRSLDALLKGSERPAAAAALRWGIQIAEALEAAHHRGIVHRDVKPANILIDGEGRARIADFGVARLPGSDLTREGLFLGSPAYTSPEQIRGDPVDGRADLFSLGATLYVALAGVRPFQGDDLPTLAYAICHVEPPPPSRYAPELSGRCDAAILRSLAKHPDRRHPSAAALAEELRALAGERGLPGAAAPSAADHGEPTLVVDTDEGPAPADSLRGERWEREAAAFGSRVGTILARWAAGVAAACGGAARDGRRAWEKGWSRGPRARRAMVAGLLIALLCLIGGSVAIVKAIEARRDTPGRRFKRAVDSLFSDAGVGAGPRGGATDSRCS